MNFQQNEQNIRPEQVEMALNEHPDIKEVSVISIAHMPQDRTLRAIIVPMKDKTLTEEDIITWCREKLGEAACPESVIFVHELPRNRVGKLSMRDIKSKWGNPFG